MADNDELRRKIAPCWHKSYDGAKGDASPREFAEMCTPGLAGFFQQHGCPQFESLRQMVEPWCIVHGQASLLPGSDYRQVEARCLELIAQYAGSPAATVVEYATRACLSLVLEAQTCGLHHGDAAVVLSRRVCIEVVEGDLLGKLGQSKVLERFEAQCGGDLNVATDSLFDWMSEASGHLPQALEDVAQKLAADPGGQTVRVRSKRAPMRSTAEIMTSWRMA